MYSVLFRIEAVDNDALLAEIWELGCMGTVEEPDGLRAFFPEPLSVEQVSAFGTYVLETRREKQPDLGDFERTGWDPVFVGERFMVAPSWLSRPTPPGRIRLTIDSTVSFGTGRHESTQLVSCHRNM